MPQHRTSRVIRWVGLLSIFVGIPASVICLLWLLFWVLTLFLNMWVIFLFPAVFVTCLPYVLLLLTGIETLRSRPRARQLALIIPSWALFGLYVVRLEAVANAEGWLFAWMSFALVYSVFLVLFFNLPPINKHFAGGTTRTTLFCAIFGILPLGLLFGIDFKTPPERSLLFHGSGVYEWRDTQNHLIKAEYRNHELNGLWREYEGGVKTSEDFAGQDPKTKLPLFMEEYIKETLIAEITYQDGQKEGPARIQNAISGLTEVGNYLDDRRDGLWKFYDRKGTLRVEGTYKNDQREGLWKLYERPGLASESFYRNGIAQRKATVSAEPAVSP
jgi:hypothetical protein